MKEKQCTVYGHEDGMRLGSYLKMKVSPQFSGKKIQEAVHNGMCRVNGKLERFASYRVCEGDRISIDFDLLKEQSIEAVTFHLLYEDDFFLCLNKPPGIECIQRNFPATFLVHRLDKDTSGCLLIAKQKQIQSHLESLFAEKKIAKVYLAVVHGIVRKKQWRVDSRLSPKKIFDGQTVYGSAEQGKSASTDFQLVKQYRDFALVKCIPYTGRTHQIRVHLSESGHPIVGDLLYAPEYRFPKGVRRQLLHAHSLRFLHPVHKEEHTIVAPLPLDYNNFVKTLEEKSKKTI